MKLKTFILAPALAVAILTSAQIAYSQTPQTQGVQGTSSVGGFGQTGTAGTGTYSDLNGFGAYGASDPTLAQGTAAAAGVGTGTEHTGINNAMAKSQTVISTLGYAQGNNTQVYVGGDAEQGNWAGTGNTNTYAQGGNATSGTYSGSDTAAAPLTGSGIGTASGKTAGQVNGDGTNNATSTIKTVGSSQGSSAFTTPAGVTPPVVSSQVNGSGTAALGSTAGSYNGPAYAAGNGSGAAQYNGINPTGASTQGSLGIVGATAGTIGANTISASSTVSSHAGVH